MTAATQALPATPISRHALADLVTELDPGQGLIVGGARLPSGDRREFEVHDPTTGEVITTVADGTESDATLAVTHAADAAAGWAATPPRERAEILRRAHDLMLADSRSLAGLISWENGKTLADARAEVAYAAEFFRWFSEEAVRLEGGYGAAPSTTTRSIVTHRPVGVAALVTPWNFPAAMVTRKWAPALAAGCTTVLKPAAETPLTAIALARILERAGLPDGVVNVVPSTRPAEVVDCWLSDPRVRKLSFTGSTAVGRTLLGRAARRVVSSSLELGGNAPFIVHADADVEAAVAGAMVAKFRNAGQACTAANRFFVHEDVASEFTARFGAAIEALVVGDPFEGHPDLGPMISAHAVEALDRVVQEAVRGGARVSHRGVVPSGTRALLSAHPAGRRGTRCRNPGRGALRSGRADRHVVEHGVLGPHGQ